MRRLSIRWKILLGVVILVGMLGFVLTWLAYDGLRSAIARQIDMRAAAIARGVGAQVPELLYVGDYYTLYQLLVTSTENNEDVRYLIVLDGRGEVVASTFGGSVPPGLLAANEPGPEGSRVALIRTPEGIVHDVAASLPGGPSEGVVRVGVSEHAARLVLRQMVQRILIAIAVLFILGTLAAFGLIDNLTSPLRELVLVARDLAAGNLARRAGLRSGDEIGAVGAALDQMADRLQAVVFELQRKERARRRLLHKVLSAQEEERRRIARELHDEVGQCFTCIAVGLRAMEGAEDVDEIRRRAGELRALAAAAAEDVQHLSRRLRPSVLDDLGLVPALERFVGDFQARFGIQAELRVVGLEERLPAEAETALYRIIQEALTNVGRHAGARHAAVVLEKVDGHVLARVEDDGRGFNLEKLCAGKVPGVDCCLGLFGIQERAELLGGEVRVESKEGRGTVIHVRIPVEEIRGGSGGEPDYQVARGGRSPRVAVRPEVAPEWPA